MPVNSDIPNACLNVPDLIAEPEILPMLDETLLNLQPMDIDFGMRDNDPLNWTSQVLSDPVNVEDARSKPADEPLLYDSELEIDIGDEESSEPSVEIDRAAPAPRTVADDLIGEDDRFPVNDISLHYDDEPMRLPSRLGTEVPSLHPDQNMPHVEGSIDVENLDNFNFNLEDTTMPVAAENERKFEHDSESPLSSVRSSVVSDLDATMFSEEPSVHQARQPASKKRKLLPLDSETSLHSNQIKKQQTDRSAILKPVAYLPRDPVLLTLMNMQQSGGFVSNIMGDGRSRGWAPELRGILSIEVIRKSGALKRKRDSGVADIGEEGDLNEEIEIPQLEIPENEEVTIQDEGIVVEDDLIQKEKSTMIDLPAYEDAPSIIRNEEDAERQVIQGSDDEVQSLIGDHFDETTAPLIHPADQGPVSLGTQHAVHLLRQRFGGVAESSPSQQKKASVLFQGLLPEATTSKADATKMFFEVLVLATKDAIKVEQSNGELGGDIRIRAKRGLWGAWAEREAGGEIAAEAEQAATEGAAS